MKTFKVSIIVGIIAFFAGKFLTKPKTKTVEVIKYVTIEVEKKKTKTTTSVKEKVNADGSSTKDTTIVEESSSEKNSNTTIASEKRKVQGNSVSVGILALKDLGEFSKDTHIGTVISVPVFGSIKATSYIDSTKRVGLGLTIDF
jgi:hypothetical protein